MEKSYWPRTNLSFEGGCTAHLHVSRTNYKTKIQPQSQHEPKQSTLGKRGLYSHSRGDARKWRGADSAHWHFKRPQGSGSWQWRWHDGNPRGETWSGSTWRGYREQPG